MAGSGMILLPRTSSVWAIALALLCGVAALRAPLAQAEAPPAAEGPAIPPAIPPADRRAPPDIEPEPSPAADRGAVLGAERGTLRTFRERITGQSLTVGASLTQARLEIQTRDGSTVERYTSGGDLTATLSYYGAPVELATLHPGAGIGGIWVLDLSGTIGGFGGRQTVQANPDGSKADGQVSGDFAYLAGGTSLWFIREGPPLPLALRFAGNVGVGTLQYRGDLNHTSAAGGAASGTLQNDGTSLQPMGTAEVEFRLAQVSLSARTVQFFGSGDSLLTDNGLTLAKLRHRFSVDVYTLGYAFEF